MNGVHYVVGDGTKVGVDCYVSGDGGATARTMVASRSKGGVASARRGNQPVGDETKGRA